MGKELAEKQPSINLENGPGCVWGILHIIKYDGWRASNKKSPRTRKGSVETPESAENFDSHNVGEKSTSSKHSVTSRIKAMVSDEIYKKKGKHRRSSSSPARSLTRTESIHRLKCSDLDFLADSALLGGEEEASANVPQNNEISRSALKSHEKPFTDKKSSNLSSQIGENQKQPMENNQKPVSKQLNAGKEGMLEQKSIDVKDLAGDGSVYHTKEFLDALAVINANKELLLTILLDPASTLANRVSNQQAFGARMGLTKSRTFPLHGSSERSSNRLKQKQDESGIPAEMEGKLKNVNQPESSSRSRFSLDLSEPSMPTVAECNKIGQYLKSNQAMGDIADSSSLSSARYMNMKGENLTAISRFKDLRKKIKYVIKESKQERRRITMDGLLHKIPPGQGFSKDTVNQDIPRSSFSGDQSVSWLNKSGLHQMNRTPSLKVSLNRYCQLYETSFNKEGKNYIYEGSKLRSEDTNVPIVTTLKHLGRILSLNDLESYSDPSGVSFDSLSSWTTIRTSEDASVCLGSNSDANKSPCLPVDDAVSSSKERLVEVSENDSGIKDEEQQMPVASDTEQDDLSSAVVDNLDQSGAQESHYEQTSEMIREPEKASSVQANDLSEEAGMESKEGMENEQDNLTKKQYESGIEAEVDEKGRIWPQFPHLEVAAKDIAEFNYVKDVLELSGLSRTGSLEIWHSDEQPVDPSIYEEVEGCCGIDPDSSGNEEDGNHLLLFDLINEVLVEIYGRSYSYCPMVLSSLSRIRPLPTRCHVLKEVWGLVSWYLSFTPQVIESVDHVVSRDLAKDDGWLNLQFHSECAGIELEDLIFDDLLEEVICTTFELS